MTSQFYKKVRTGRDLSVPFYKITLLSSQKKLRRRSPEFFVVAVPVKERLSLNWLFYFTTTTGIERCPSGVST
jgi:hypothetical protein